MENQTTENFDIQEYADAHCGGNRLQAIYSIIYSDKECQLDPYIDSMTRDEANFTLLLVRRHAASHYNGEKNYQKVLRAYSTLSSLGLEDVDPNSPNPFKKSLLKHLVFLVCAIFVPIVLSLFLTDASWITSLQPILIGLTSMSTATNLISFLRYNKVKSFFASLPERGDNDPIKVPFEEVLKDYNEYLRSRTTYEVAEKALQHSKKANISALVWLPAYQGLNTVTLIAAYFNVVAGAVCCALIPAFFVWKIPRAFKAVMKARDAVDGLPECGQAVQTPMEKRQQGCALGMIGVALLYILTGLFTIAVAISFMTR